MECAERRPGRPALGRAWVSVVGAWLVLGLLGSAPRASEAAVVATYRFNDTLTADEPGALALGAVDPLGAALFETADVFGQSRRVYRFDGNSSPVNQQAGLVLATAELTSPTTYSVEAVFAFDGTSDYRRVLDVENRASDSGIYVNPDGHLELFADDDTLATGTTPFTSGFHHVVLVVAADTVRVYLDGALEFAVASGAMNLDNPNNPQHLLNFFLDNVTGGGQGEFTDGRIALIRLHDGALTGGEVVQLFHEVQGLPSLTVALSDTAFPLGGTLTLTAELTPGTTPANVDAYIVVQLPGGEFVSVLLEGPVPDVVPIASTFVPSVMSGQVLAYTFTGLEPSGTYTVLAGLTHPGTLDVIGVIQQASFSFAP